MQLKRATNAVGWAASMISMTPSYLLYFIPVLMAVSFVMSATRFEHQPLIIKNGIYTAVWIVAFLLIVAAVMQVVLWMI